MSTSVARPLPLAGVRVIEFEGLAPTVFCGMILADFGAEVTIINRREQPPASVALDTNQTFLNRGKRSIAVDFKNTHHIEILKKLIAKADIVIDSFRPGKLEAVGLGPTQVDNPKLVFARITGYGQTGTLKDKAGHDLNYLSYSGMLSTFGKHPNNPEPPNNILADFAGGGAFGVVGILLALLEARKTGKGQVVDVSLTDCVGYMGSFLLNMKKLHLWNAPRGSNLLDGGAPFYQTYKCSDGKYLAVGCIEREFYARFLKGLDMENITNMLRDQRNQSTYASTQQLFTQRLSSKTRDEWMEIFDPLDCCVTPVLELQEIHTHKDTKRMIIMENETQSSANNKYPFTFTPVPALSNHQDIKGRIMNAKTPQRGQDTEDVLREYGITKDDIKKFSQISPKL